MDVECYADEDTCSESLCPELCEADDEVVIANCYKPPWSDQYAPGKCYCLCEDEGGRETCFAFGARGADFTYEWFDTATECGDSDTCDSVCEDECVFGFGSTETRCEEGVCKCLCGVCQFTGERGLAPPVMPGRFRMTPCAPFWSALHYLARHRQVRNSTTCDPVGAQRVVARQLGFQRPNKKSTTSTTHQPTVSPGRSKNFPPTPIQIPMPTTSASPTIDFFLGMSNSSSLTAR